MGHFNPYRARVRRTAKARATRAPVEYGDGFVSASTLSAKIGFKNAQGNSYNTHPKLYMAFELLGYGRYRGIKFEPSAKMGDKVRKHHDLQESGEVRTFNVYSPTLVDEVRGIMDKVEPALEKRRSALSRAPIEYPEGYSGVRTLSADLGLGPFALQMILEKLGHMVKIGGKYLPSATAMKEGHTTPMASNGEGKEPWYAWKREFVLKEVGSHIIANPSDKNLGE